jgi:hypothetical protein
LALSVITWGRRGGCWRGSSAADRTEPATQQCPDRGATPAARERPNGRAGAGANRRTTHSALPWVIGVACGKADRQRWQQDERRVDRYNASHIRVLRQDISRIEGKTGGIVAKNC